MSPWSLLVLLPIGLAQCKSSPSAADGSVPATEMDARKPGDDEPHAGYQPGEFGYRYSEIPLDTGLRRFATPRTENQSPEVFTIGARGPYQDVSIDEKGRVWRTRAPEGGECVGVIESSKFQAMLALRESASSSEFVVTDGPCKDCGGVNAQLYLPNRTKILLGASGANVLRRPSPEANALLRWLLAVAIQASHG